LNKNDERHIYHYEMTFWSSSDRARYDITLEDVVRVLQRAVDEGANTKPINRDEQILVLREVSPSACGRYFALFIAMLDTKSQGKVFAQRKTLKQRTVNKTATEDGEFGCHLVLDRDALDATNCRYYALLESVNGLNRSHISTLLNAVIRQYHNGVDDGLFQGEDLSGARDRTGHPKTIGYRPLVHLEPLPSTDFISALNAGGLKGVTLRKKQVVTKLGQRSYLAPKSHEIELKVDSKKLRKFSGNIWDDLSIAINAEAQDWDEAEVIFDDGEGRRGRTKVNTKTLDILDETYVKRSFITGITPPLNDSSPGVLPHMVAAMIGVRND
jgi:hypothetical protein